jgi:LacI family transcriptional regulator
LKQTHIRIGLVFAQNLSYCRGVLRGIKEFAAPRSNWVLLPVAPEPRAVRALESLQPTGIIAHLYSQPLARSVFDLGKPVVNVSGAMRKPPTPRVGTDDWRCGQIAAEHLLDRGFRHFAFVGHWDHFYSVTREAAFRDRIGKAGFEVLSYHEARRQPFEPLGRLWSLDERISRWMKNLPRPIGIFASNDIWGMQLTEVCRQAGLRVPEDVAILGVDNDDLLCELARPALSSISVPAERIGIEAATMLERLLKGKAVTREPVLFPPSGVFPRRSSDVLAIADPEVAAAVRFIRDQGHRPLQTRDVLAAVPISRRSLERRFQASLGRTPHDEIRRVHVEHACRLLTETDLPMRAVAERSGFSDAKQLSVIFRQVLGQTPTAYRIATRGLTWRWGRATE